MVGYALTCGCLTVAVLALMCSIARRLLEPRNEYGPRRYALIAAFVLLAVALLGGNIHPYE